ncbi:hypothetical protein [Dyadobacter arcticus]|uniref:LPS export ABC transporter periplasmic protein LptC n=1 Tax=Dyadobacter arcticus TaxID=1078754 RepID=A0ABX0URW4_9BACT|nr:hypothetical protein [Dyadobacter arcticus]NIJ55728.1 hypothetical protein [Dyadobacter arcticus]
MKHLVTTLLAIGVMAFTISSCQKKKTTDAQTEQILQSLKDNQAKILIKIDGKEFYAPESVFTGQLLLSDQALNMTLMDQFEGKTILNLGKAKWYAGNPIEDNINANNLVSTNVKMGKIVDVQKMIGEGYMMADGNIEALEYSKDQIVFKLTGKVGRYSDFQQPDKYLPLDGLIIYKKPAFSLANITEKEAFSSSTKK